jgi:hypothetical protein
MAAAIEPHSNPNTKTKNGNAIFSLKNPYWV